MGPIRGQIRPAPVLAEITPQKIGAKFNASIHNRFDVEVIDAETGEVKQRAQAENVICNQLWTQIFSPATYFNYIHYGTGSGTPAASNTSLFTFLGYGAISGIVYNTPSPGVYTIRGSIQLSETTAVGSMLTEVGVGFGSASSSLCTHAMLKDLNGNQISITKTSIDIINIYATVFLHYSTAEIDGITILPASTFMSYLLGQYNGSGQPPIRYADVAFANTCQSLGGTSLTQTIKASNKQIILTGARIAAADSNISGLTGFMLYGYKVVQSGYTISLDPALYCKVDSAWYAGSDIVGETIGTGDGTTINFSADFPIASGLKIYIDGVETSAFTYDVNFPKHPEDMGRYFVALDAKSTDANHIMAFKKTAPCSSSSAWTGGLYYNPYYSLGIKTLRNYNCNVSASNDLSAWVTIVDGGSNVFTVPSAYRKYKYWKITSSVQSYFSHTFVADVATENDLHFTIAPANGAVITCDYHTDCIAKDINHVFDFSLVIQLGEHTT